MTISEFEAFCSSHRIRFEYQPGFPSEPLLTKTFRVSPAQSKPGGDARKWLESYGVTFSPNASARWNAKEQTLTVKNTEDNLNLVERIIEVTKSR